jgi:lambda family phage minor tail protein L
MPLEEDVGQLAVGTDIQLFVLDLGFQGGGVVYFTPSVDQTLGVVNFGGIPYQPVDMIIEGMEYNGRSVLPRPTIKIANTQRIITALIYDYNDLVGCTVKRIRTLSKYLDGQPEADSNAHWPIDNFRIMQKSMLTKMYVEFTLCAAIDVEGQKVPGRLVLHNYCKRIYRRWDAATNSFDYSQAQCPYTGSSYFVGNTPTGTAANDLCLKDVASCAARFNPLGVPLPTWAFPGAGRFGDPGR